MANDTVRERLASLAQRSPAFLLLLGASGTGKSSLVRAGILPRLQADRGRWQLLAPFNPGPVPLLRLAQVLQEAWDTLGKSPPSAEAGEREESTLLRQLQWLHATTQAPVLLVVDQFEELLVEQQPEADRFLRFLQEVLRLELSGVVLLATLRSDFLELLQNHCPVLAGMATALPVQPIQSEDFGELILGPAQRSGLTLQPGLQERLVKESGGRDALPLLAFTLEKLWQKRQERGGPVEGAHGVWYDLTLADYQTLGGVTGAVSSQAALCWDPHTSNEADTAALREAFLFHLVRLNEEGLATKQAARWDEIPERSRPLLRRFVKARLVVSSGEIGGDMLEIAHEALLRTWEPLVQWIVEGRLDLEQRRRVLRLCGDLGLNQPLEVRLAALEGLLTLAESDLQLAATASEALTALLSEAKRDLQEWPLAIRLLELVGGEASVEALSAFLEHRQLREPMDIELAEPVLEALSQAAATLQTLHRRHPPANDDAETRWLLLPSATVSDNGRAVRTQLVRLRLWATPQLEGPGAWFEPLGEGEALTMVAIPAGSFLMGSPVDEYARSNDEGPQHQVSLKGFWISQTPITQAQWGKVMGTNPSEFQRKLADNCRRPVEQVSWLDAMSFCARLSERTGRTYILPNEAQWEYACRAGTTTPFHYGAAEVSELANFNAFAFRGRRAKGNYLAETSPVGIFPANDWGLHDMHGNVREWCTDPWHGSYEGAPTDGHSRLLPERSMDDNKQVPRVYRGGGWSDHPSHGRSAYRCPGNPTDVIGVLGFRVVCLPLGISLTPKTTTPHC